jgi:hypothetical protein
MVDQPLEMKERGGMFPQEGEKSWIDLKGKEERGGSNLFIAILSYKCKMHILDMFPI